MQTKNITPKLTQKQIAKERRFSYSSLKRYTKDIKMQGARRLAANNHERSQMLSNDPKRPRMTPKETVNKSAKSIMNKKYKLKGDDPNDNPLHAKVLKEIPFTF